LLSTVIIMINITINYYYCHY